MSQPWMFFSKFEEAHNINPPGKAIVDYLTLHLPDHQVPCEEVSENGPGCSLACPYCSKNIDNQGPQEPPKIHYKNQSVIT